MKYNDPDVNHRPFFGSLFFTEKGDLDLSWLFVLMMGLAGVVGFLHEVFNNKTASIAAWSFLGTAFASVLIAAIPVQKARILADSRMPGEVSHGIASSTPQGFEPNKWENEDDPDSGEI